MTHRKAWEQQMIYLMMIDAEEDKQKFAILYETYRHLMMKVALNVLKDTFLAEDAVHEAFIKIAKNMEKIGEIDATVTKRYLLTITKNATIDIYRKRNHQFQREIYVDELEECNVPVTYAETDVDDGILDILRCLPVKYRDVFLLKYSGNMGNDPNATNRDVIGNFDVEIKLDKNGRLRLNLFSHATDSYSNSLDYSQRNGVGIVYQQGFDSFRQLFRKRTPEEKESRRQIKELEKLQRAERHKKAKANANTIN